MDEDRQRRLAMNEAVARDVNAAVEEVASGRHGQAERIELICECSRDSCAERILVTLDEYYAVRANAFRFMLIDAHVDEAIERRVGTAGNATVVEKTGAGREVAGQTG